MIKRVLLLSTLAVASLAAVGFATHVEKQGHVTVVEFTKPVELKIADVAVFEMGEVIQKGVETHVVVVATGKVSRGFVRVDTPPPVAYGFVG